MNSITVAASLVSSGLKRLRELSSRMVKKIEGNNAKPATPAIPDPPNLVAPPEGPPEIVVFGAASIDYIT